MKRCAVFDQNGRLVLAMRRGSDDMPDFTQEEVEMVLASNKELDLGTCTIKLNMAPEEVTEFESLRQSGTDQVKLENDQFVTETKEEWLADFATDYPSMITLPENPVIDVPGDDVVLDPPGGDNP